MLLTSSAPTDARSDRASDQALVVLDAHVEDIPQLIADLPSTHVLVLDSADDGIEQITSALQTHQAVSSLHIISHGTSGCLTLGNTQLSWQTVSYYTEQLQAWAQVLQGRDILLYGCQVAKGTIGHVFLQQLHQLTGANIAASSQRVGRVGAGHHWTLETHIGQVETAPIFSSHLQQTYAGHFETVNFSISTDTLIESEGTPFSFNFSVDGEIPPGGSVVRLEGSIPQAINQLNLFALSVSGLAGQPVDVSPGQDFSEFEVTIVEPNASISLPVFNDFQDDSPQEITWTVTPVSAGTTVNNGSATVTIFDDPSEVPPPPAANPEISLTSDITTLVEDEGSEVTFTISLTEPPSASGLLVDIGTGKTFALGDFDVFPPAPQATVTGGQLVAGFPDNSGFTLAIFEQTATVTLPIFDDEDRTENGAETDPDGPLRNDDIGEEQTTFSILPRDGYTISPTTSSVTLTLRDTNVVNTPPNADDDSYSTTVDVPLTVSADAGVLNGDSDADGDPLVATFVDAPSNGSIEFNEDGSFTYTPNAGFVGTDSFTYQASDGTDASEIATVSITVEDDQPPVGDEPVVSFSTTPEVISEAEGTALVMNFSVAGEIPEGGLEVGLSGDTARILQEFTAAQVRFNENLELIYRFDAGVADSVVGGELDLFSLEDDPTSPGFLSNFVFTITESTASITLPVLDDILEEADETFTYTLVDGEDYAVDPAASSSSFTVTDGVSGGVGPTVGVTAAPLELFESEQTRVELTFTVEGDIPPEGVVVEFASDVPRAVAEFDISASNPRDPQDQFSVDGPVVEGGAIVGSNEIASSLLFRITEPTATLSVEVFQDDDAEGLETFTYTLLDGEGYQVDPTANEATITIDDEPTVGELPVVSFTASPTSLNEAEGTPITFNFSVEGAFPEDGVVVRTAENFFPNPQLDFNLLDFENPDVINGIEFFSFEETESGQFIIDWRLTQPEAFIAVAVFDDNLAEPDSSFTTGLVPGDGYTLNPDATSATISVTDGVDGVGGPVVSLAVEPTELNEGEPLTITLTAEGDIPEGGIEVLIDSPTTGALGEFITLDEEGNPDVMFEGLAGFPTPNEDGSGFAAIMTGNTATISFDVFDDGPGEGPETFEFEVLDGENYDVNPEATAVAITINDEPAVGELPVVSFTASPTSLNEAEGTPITFNFSVEGAFPEDGVVVRTAENFFPNPQLDFNLLDFENPDVINGIEFFSFEETESGQFIIDWRLTQPEAFIAVAVFDDNLAEPDSSFTTGLVPGDGYTLNPDATSATISVTDGVDGVGGPVVSLAVEPTELNEGEPLTITLTAEGDIPEGGIEVLIDSPTTGALGEFITLDEEGNPDVMFEGLAGFPTPNEDGSGFAAIMTGNTATISFDVFDDGPGEGPETFEFEVLDGENYDVNPEATAVAITINEADEGMAFEVESGVTSVFLDLELLEQAAGLTVVSIDSNAEPFSEDFQVGFAITEETDFSFTADPFAPVGGTIEHSGTLTFGLAGAEATLGEFSIGFDPSRVTDTASGFFVADTLNDPLGLEILFDVGNPGMVSASEDSLVISDADLLLAPELAAALGLAELAGADVGDTRIDTPEEAAVNDLFIDLRNLDGPVEAEFTVNREARFDNFVGYYAVIDASGGIDIDGDGTADIAPGDDGYTEAALDAQVETVGLTTPNLTESAIIGEFEGGSLYAPFLIADGTIDDPDSFELSEVYFAFEIANADGVEHIRFEADQLLFEDLPGGGDNDFDDLVVSFTIDTEGGEGAIEFDIVGTEGDDVLTAMAEGSNIDGLGGDDIITGDAANDILVGNAGSDVARGDDGNDIIFGGDGGDIVDGQAGNDIVSGDADDDEVIGGSGDDILMGVTGNDVLIGGTGSDLFVFGNGDGTDIIVDFEVGVDQIGLVEGELVFADLSLTQNGSDTLLGVTSTSETLAVLTGVMATDLSESSFMIVPDVSNPEEAIALV